MISLLLLSRRDHDAFAQDPASLNVTLDITLAENTRLASDAIVTLVGVTAPQRILLVLVRGVLEATALGCGQSIFCFQTTGREVLIGLSAAADRHILTITRLGIAWGVGGGCQSRSGSQQGSGCGKNEIAKMKSDHGELLGHAVGRMQWSEPVERRPTGQTRKRLMGRSQLHD